MPRLTRITRLAFFSVALCAGLSAQVDRWDASFKFYGGGTIGGAKDLFNTTGNFGGGAEGTYKLDGSGSLVFDLGYRFFPGTNSIQSYITLPALTATSPAGMLYSGETRDRKTDGSGWQASALYRRNAFTGGMYWQAGLRIGFNKTKQTDTGAASSYITTKTPATAPAVWTVTATSAINSVEENKTTSIGLLGGIGYRFNDQYSGELNVFQTKFEAAAAGKQNGAVVELAFGVRF